MHSSKDVAPRRLGPPEKKRKGINSTPTAVVMVILSLSTVRCNARAGWVEFFARAHNFKAANEKKKKERKVQGGREEHRCIVGSARAAFLLAGPARPASRARGPGRHTGRGRLPGVRIVPTSGGQTAPD